MVKSVLPNVFRKFRFVWILFVCERFDMIPVSLFKRAWSHAYVVLSVVCIVCADGCLIYNIFVHALIL